jgi:outer membrane protein assembly factor BamB
MMSRKYLLEDKDIRDEIIPMGFIVGSKNIYVTTKRGRLFIADIKTGQTDKILRIDRGIISRPFVSNQNLYIIKDNSIIKLD